MLIKSLCRLQTIFLIQLHNTLVLSKISVTTYTYIDIIKYQHVFLKILIKILYEDDLFFKYSSVNQELINTLLTDAVYSYLYCLTYEAAIWSGVPLFFADNKRNSTIPIRYMTMTPFLKSVLQHTQINIIIYQHF